MFTTPEAAKELLKTLSNFAFYLFSQRLVSDGRSLILGNRQSLIPGTKHLPNGHKQNQGSQSRSHKRKAEKNLSVDTVWND
jgi:hypothetical protein